MADKENKEKQTAQLPLVPYDLDKSRWIKTPIVFSRQGASLSLLQQHVMMMASKHLQKFIDGYFNEGRNMEHRDPSPAIPDDVLRDDKLVVVLPLSEITSSDRYGKLAAALDDIGELKMRVKVLEVVKDKDGNPLLTADGLQQVRAVLVQVPIFSKLVVPLLDKRYVYTDIKTQEERMSALLRAGYIEMKINPDVARTIFDMNRGYIEHLADIAKYSKKSSTPRIYLLLKIKMFQKQMRPDIPLSEIKKFTGHLVIDPETGAVVSEQYPKFSQYAKRVLDPARDDLRRMALLNQTEFIFSYQAKYKPGNLRGNPDSVEFTIQATALGIAHRKAKGKSQKVIESSLMNENPTLVRNEIGRRDWNALVSAYHGVLSDVFGRAVLHGVVSDEKGNYFYVILESEDDDETVYENRQEFYHGFCGLMHRLYGNKYYKIGLAYRQKKDE